MESQLLHRWNTLCKDIFWAHARNNEAIECHDRWSAESFRSIHSPLSTANTMNVQLKEKERWGNRCRNKGMKSGVFSPLRPPCISANHAVFFCRLLQYAMCVGARVCTGEQSFSLQMRMRRCNMSTARKNGPGGIFLPSSSTLVSYLYRSCFKRNFPVNTQKTDSSAKTAITTLNFAFKNSPS